ncbi:MAG: protein kinase [Spirochaetales bacterium]|nr:protein kinase [Spirochaetales bacterium]
MGINFKRGDKIRGYTITSDLLNHGNFAMAYLAENYGRRKLFLKEYIEPTSIRSWYRDYIRYQEKMKKRLAQLPGGCVVEIIEFFEEKNLYFQVFECIEGDSLRKMMKKSVDDPDLFPDSLRWDSAKLFMFDMSRLHQQNIVHCDLKPENAFMEKVPGLGIGMRIKLIDFDFSFIHDDPPPWVPRDAAQGRPGFLGTPNYFSPEHLTGKTPTPASDVFTCGIILYELLCGTYPLSGYKSFKEYLLKFVNKEFALPHELNSDIPLNLSHLMARMLDIRPGNRPTAKEVHQELLSPSEGPPVIKAPEYIKLMIGDSENYKPVEKTSVLGQRDFRSFENYKYLQANQFEIIKDKDTGQWFISGKENVKNNTRLNGKVITGEKAALSDGDIISVGPFKTRVSFA